MASLLSTNLPNFSFFIDYHKQCRNNQVPRKRLRFPIFGASAPPPTERPENKNTIPSPLKLSNVQTNESNIGKEGSVIIKSRSGVIRCGSKEHNKQPSSDSPKKEEVISPIPKQQFSQSNSFQKNPPSISIGRSNIGAFTDRSIRGPSVEKTESKSPESPLTGIARQASREKKDTGGPSLKVISLHRNPSVQSREGGETDRAGSNKHSRGPSVKSPEPRDKLATTQQIQTKHNSQQAQSTSREKSALSVPKSQLQMAYFTKVGHSTARDKDIFRVNDSGASKKLSLVQGGGAHAGDKANQTSTGFSRKGSMPPADPETSSTTYYLKLQNKNSMNSRTVLKPNKGNSSGGDTSIREQQTHRPLSKSTLQQNAFYGTNKNSRSMDRHNSEHNKEMHASHMSQERSMASSTLRYKSTTKANPGNAIHVTGVADDYSKETSREHNSSQRQTTTNFLNKFKLNNVIKKLKLGVGDQQKQQQQMKESTYLTSGSNNQVLKRTRTRPNKNSLLKSVFHN